MTTTTTPDGGSAAAAGPDERLELAHAVEAAFGAALADADVSEAGAVEGGLVDVVRRGRRERLQLLAQGPLFLLLRERGAEVDVINVRLPGGLELCAAPLVDGRVAVSVRKPVAAQARVERLVDEGLLPAGVDAELVAAVHEGRGIAVVGPSRSGRVRLASAIARAVSTTLRCTSLGDEVPAGCQPAPAVPHLVARARTAVSLGADVVVGVELSVREAVDLATSTPGAPLVASIVAPSVDVVTAAVGDKLFAASFPLVAVVGFSPDGRARLLELHGGSPAEGAPASTASTAAVTVPATSVSPGAAPNAAACSTVASSLNASAGAASAAGARARGAPEPGAAATVDAPVALGEAPPADWASADADDDPGWELGSLASGGASLPPSSASFDAALVAAAKRPSFAPRAPSAHPAMHTLRGTGGLTFEPPGGGAADDDDGESNR
jgi:hypothetical protein